MTKFYEVFLLELRALVRSKTVAMLVVASVAWMLAFPHVVRGDGTAEGLRELTIRFSLGGVLALLVVALLASATGSLARERAARRLQLTLVRPVRYVAVALGKIAAHVVAGAAVLGVACLVVVFSQDMSVPCNHVLSPIMPTPREEAEAMYGKYMADPKTPDAVRRARKSVVLRILENRAADRYDTIQTNSVMEWRFGDLKGLEDLSVRMRFTNQMDMRQTVRGVFGLGGLEGAVSNVTQAVLTVPLRRRDGAAMPSGESRLVFENRGDSALMLRPRRDINILAAADTFGWNLLRAYLEMVAILSLVVSLGVLLSAGLGRPVALFVAIVALVVGEASPSIVEQYPNELEANAVDRIGLAITRFSAGMTRPVSSLSPLGALSRDERIEPQDVALLMLSDIVLAPLLLSLLASLAMSCKQEEA